MNHVLKIVWLLPEGKELKRTKPLTIPVTFQLEVHSRMQQKGQGSLEYLLIIGGGILVAVVIIGAIVSLAGTGTGGTRQNIANQTCATFLQQDACVGYNVEGASAGTCGTNYTNYTTGSAAGSGDCCWSMLVGASGDPGVGRRCQAKNNLTFT